MLSCLAVLTFSVWPHTSMDRSESPPLLMATCMLHWPELWLSCTGASGDIPGLPAVSRCCSVALSAAIAAFASGLPSPCEAQSCWGSASMAAEAAGASACNIPRPSVLLKYMLSVVAAESLRLP